MSRATDSRSFAGIIGLALALALSLASGAASAQELLQELVPDPTSNHKFFGEKLAIDGDTAVMGDYNYMMEGNCGFQEHGAVQVLKKVGSEWQKTEFFRYPDDTEDIQRHGWSVAIKGNVIVAATPGKRWVNGGDVRLNVGALTVYKRPTASAPFAYAGRVFLPNPEPNDFLGWPVDMASNGVYAVAVSSMHRDQIRVFQVDPTPQYLTTISFPDGGAPWSMFITNQNILVADSAYFATPFAWKLNGSQATPIDTSALGNAWDSTRGYLTGDGDSIAWIVEDGYAGQDVLRIAKFGAESVLSTSTHYLPQGGGRLPMTLKEDQGLFFADSDDSFSSYKYVGGGYRFQGNVYHPGMWGRSLAFNGTDLLIGDRSPEHPINALCGPAHGSIWAYRPMAPSAPGPGASTMLQPWSHTPVFSNGAAVATSGSFAVSAAPDTYSASGTGGAVLLYQKVNGAWQQVEQYIDNWNGARGVDWSGFGAAVDINSDFLMVGVPWEMNIFGYQPGAVQFVRKTNGVFNLGPWLEEIEAPSYDEYGENFGNSVALSGNTLFVGAPAFYSGPGSPYAGGSVYVFTWDGFFWNYRQQIRNSNVQPYEGFGYRVAASGDYLIVGIPYRSTNGRTANGAAQIFRRDLTTGDYVSAGEFSAPFGLGDYANFGNAVSISADYAAAGSQAGNVVVYRRSGSTWSQHAGMPITSSQWGFGSSLAIEGGNLVVGSPWESRVHRYQRVVTFGVARWLRTGTLVGPTSSFGTSADIEGGVVSLGETYGAIGGRTTGASYMLNFLDIR